MKAPVELEAAINRYKNGNREAFDEVYNLSHKYLYVCILHIVKEEDTAKDMLQETYLEISRSISQLKNAEDFLSWAAVIARRKCFAYFNKSDKFVLSGEDAEQDLLENIADDEAFIPEFLMQDMEKRRLIREIIDGLSDMQRLCVIGYYYYEQKQEEIAEELGIPVNTVKSHLNRAKAKIREEVLTLEREKDTKLYALAPFMLLFFAEEAEACEAVPMSEELKDAVKTEKSPSIAERLAQISVRGKLLIGAVVLLAGAAAVIGVVVSRPREEAQEISEEGAETAQTGEPEELQETENIPETEMETEISEENEPEENTELAISGMYDQLSQGRDGIIVVSSGGKWGLVTYDNQVIVPVEYDFASTAPNDDGQTFFGNAGNYQVFDKEGNVLFETDKPIKAVSDGVVLWVETDDNMTYNFGYVKLDGTVLYESDGEDVEGQAGAVGFSEGCAFSSNGDQSTEYRIAADGTTTDIYEERVILRHPELLNTPVESSSIVVNGTGSDINYYYPIGACYQGYYVDRGVDFFEDTGNQFYVYDAEGTEQYWLRMEAAAEYAGFPYSWENGTPDWNLRGFYHNGNYCYSNQTKVAVSLTYGEETKAYLLDLSKLEEREAGWTTMTFVTDDTVLAQGEYVGIGDTAYWLIQKDGQWGYIDHEGRVVQMFDDAAAFYGGKAMVIQDGYASFVDEDMNLSEWKIPAQSVTGHGEVFAVTTEEGQKCYTAAE